MNKKQNVYSIHYSCSGFYGGGSLAPTVCCIALCNIRNGKIHSFSLDDYIKQSKSLIESEMLLLKDFVEFFNKINNPFLIHWRMGESEFGFKAIIVRCENFGIDNLNLDKIVDFDLSKYSIYSLINALEENNCDKVTLLSGKKEAIAFNNGQFKLVKLSTEAKAIGLAELFKKYTTGNWCGDFDAAKKTEETLINTPTALKLYKMLCDITNSQEKIYEIIKLLKTDADKEFLIRVIEDGKTNINLLAFLANEYMNAKKEVA